MRQKLLRLQTQKAAADSSSLGLEEISSCSSGRNSILSPHLQQGFHLLCQLSAQNVSGLSDWSFQRRPCLSAWLPPHFPFKARNEVFFTSCLEKIKSWCAFCNLNNRNNADAFDKFHSHTLCSHTGPATHDSKQFSCLSLRCHKHYKFQKVLSGCLCCFFFFSPRARWGSCVILPQELGDSVACACSKARRGFAPRLPLRLVLKPMDELMSPWRPHWYALWPC